MQENWYADDCDLMKWAALIHLAKKEKAKSILQVVFYTWPGERPNLNLNQQSVPFPPEVWAHFRALHQIRRLRPANNVTVDVLDLHFKSLQDLQSSHSRVDVPRKIRLKLSKMARPSILFLDPDTGIEPPKDKPNFRHVSTDQLKQAFALLRYEDWIVLYQHQRHDKT